MSRVGNLPIIILPGVTVEKNSAGLMVQGPKGNLSLKVASEIRLEVKNGQIIVKRMSEQKRVKALHGLTRNLISNMILGVTSLWTKNLELVGVGFRAQTEGSKLVLSVGYSHPVEVLAPTGITLEVSDNTKIKVSGIDKELVGQVAANIKKVRLPDVYKGKGIRYEGEYIRKKAGKSAKIGVGAPGGAK